MSRHMFGNHSPAHTVELMEMERQKKLNKKNVLGQREGIRNKAAQTLQAAAM